MPLAVVIGGFMNCAPLVPNAPGSRLAGNPMLMLNVLENKHTTTRSAT